MASTNPNAPYGFRVIKNANGDYPTIRTMTASASVALAHGSIARLKTDGTVAMWDGTKTNGYRALVGGVVAGLQAADTDRTVKICSDPEAEYEVMLDDGSVTGINGLIGRNFKGASMTSRNATLNQSKAILDASTGSSIDDTTSTDQRAFRAIRFSGEVGNVTSQSFARVIVKINNVHQVFGTAPTTV